MMVDMTKQTELDVNVAVVKVAYVTCVQIANTAKQERAQYAQTVLAARRTNETGLVR